LFSFLTNTVLLADIHFENDLYPPQITLDSNQSVAVTHFRYYIIDAYVCIYFRKQIHIDECMNVSHYLVVHVLVVDGGAEIQTGRSLAGCV
jgi:hypothetical protein